MNKLIRIHEDTYNRLEALRGKRETFDGVVQRLCSVMETIKAIPDTLGPNHPLLAKRGEEQDIIRQARLERADLEERRLK